MNQHAIQQSLIQHLDWLQELLNLRMQEYFQTGASEDSFAFPPPPPPDLTVPLDRQFEEFQLCREEKVIVLLALAPHLKPQLLDVFYTNNPSLNRHFTEFGGIKGKIHSGFLPTKETAVFLLAGGDLHKRIKVTRLLQSDQKLYDKQILERDTHQAGDPPLSSPLNLAKTFLPTVLWDRPYSPDFGSGFPAHRVKTQQDWDDLILAPYVMEQVMEIKAWMEHENRIQKEWGLQKFIKPGYRSLFFGPPGTGKTLTASLLGKSLNREVYRIDLAMVISKYIGETEKNLANLFDLAAHRNWILFFDEADALFGKRTLTKSSNDRYANQEVSYLLQRIEDFPGLVILASNFKGNLDDAFVRRFQSMIHFPVPEADQRWKLWQKAFAEGLQLSDEVDLRQLSERHEVTGGEIINVLRYVAIQTAKRGLDRVLLEDVLEGLSKEFQKNGKSLGLA